MVKIQYGIAGFFCGVFTGFLFVLVELRLIDNTKYPNKSLVVIAATIILCGTIGIYQGLKLEKKRRIKK
jgi:hypothetical protein